MTERSDPRLAPFAQLPQGRRGPMIVVEGEIAVARALRGEHPVGCLLTTATHRARLRDAIDPSLPVLEADAQLIRDVVGFDFHRGCLAAMPRPVEPSVEALVERLGSGERRGKSRGSTIALVAQGLADPVNLGAIIRNARAFGVGAVLHGKGADPWSRRAIRASMGLGFGMPVVECGDLCGAVQQLRRGLEPVRVVAAVVQPGAVPLAELELPPRAATIVLVGNEGRGLDPSLRRCADEAVTIPLAPEVDSLNVAAATAILLWSLCSGRR